MNKTRNAQHFSDKLFERLGHCVHGWGLLELHEKLEEEGMITRQYNRILINEVQYKKMQEALSLILADDE